MQRNSRKCENFYLDRTYANNGKNDEEITKCLEEIIKIYRKNSQELINDDALSLTVEKLKQPNKKSRKKVNGNPQQVGNFIS